MLQSAGDGKQGIPDFNEVSSPERRSSDQRLLAKILRDDGGGLSGSQRARVLIAAHGDLNGVLRTESHRLKGLVHLSDEELGLLEIMRRAAGLFSENDSLNKPAIGSLSALKAYLQSSLERDISLLLLDQRNRLQADVGLNEAVPRNQVSAAHVVRLALEYGASAAIVVQSWRSVAISFEPALIDRAKIVERSLRVVDIILQDYVLRSDDRCISMRASGLICRPE
jgi:DNA repair protein RadC